MLLLVVIRAARAHRDDPGRSRLREAHRRWRRGRRQPWGTIPAERLEL